MASLLFYGFYFCRAKWIVVCGCVITNGHSFSFVWVVQGRIGETKKPQGGAPEGFCGEDEILSPLRYESATR